LRNRGTVSDRMEVGDSPSQSGRKPAIPTGTTCRQSEMSGLRPPGPAPGPVGFPQRVGSVEAYRALEGAGGGWRGLEGAGPVK
jgi:hypothetical protein